LNRQLRQKLHWLSIKKERAEDPLHHRRLGGTYQYRVSRNALRLEDPSVSSDKQFQHDVSGNPDVPWQNDLSRHRLGQIGWNSDTFDVLEFELG
jgi:hypothetical protein